jgi:hypothetical protein
VQECDAGLIEVRHDTHMLSFAARPQHDMAKVR